MGILSAATGWISAAFSEDGTPSSSRILTALHSMVVSFALIFVTIKNHAIPDATILGGMGVFATIHYAVNSTKSIVQSFSKNPVVPNPNQTTDNMNQSSQKQTNNMNQSDNQSNSQANSQNQNQDGKKDQPDKKD